MSGNPEATVKWPRWPDDFTTKHLGIGEGNVVHYALKPTPINLPPFIEMIGPT